MYRKLFLFPFFLIVLTLVLNTGCGTGDSSGNKIAYISSNPGSEYENTFKELQLGILFDFELRLPHADRSWVDIWVEGYSNGKAVEPFPLTSLAYGLSPNEVEEGHMGFGIINPTNDKAQFFLYTNGIRTGPHSIGNNFFEKSGISSWDYAIGSETIGLESGEEVLLAVYRQGKESLRADYDYQDIDAINKMINEDMNIVLLKMKVTSKEE